MPWIGVTLALIAAIGLASVGIISLRDGVFRAHGSTLNRKESPVAFWARVLLFFALSAMFLGLAAFFALH
ncbi:MAG TPA: hypothetical protein VIM11_08285 [Tepidisphaeraceae bacterium]|jgi:hypothetical protein